MEKKIVMFWFINAILVLLFIFGVENVDYVNPYLGGIPHPKFDQPTLPYIGFNFQFL
jgi:hypothetical protein